MKKYVLFVSHSYSYDILRPIQTEIRRRGGQAAWYIENTSPNFLHKDEQELTTIQEVIQYNPLAIFAPGNHIYDFLPGIKVEVFHGLYYKRKDYGDHYRIRGWFDLYCTTSSLFLPRFEELAKELGFFKVVHTGWSKFDAVAPSQPGQPNDPPVIIYSPTFSEKYTSATDFFEPIRKIANTKNWKWIISLHPKTDEETINNYKVLANNNQQVTFDETEDKIPLYRQADVMISDSSSVVYEFLWHNKPVVTYRNTFPGDHLIDINDPEQLQTALEMALQRPPQLMQNIRTFMDQVHPYRDGKASARILDAVDEFEKKYKGKLKAKPCNIIRKLKMRKKAGYYPFGPRYKTKEQ